MQNVISVEALSALINVASSQVKAIRIIDCRFSLMDAEYGNKAYLQDHIPGAIYANLNLDLSGEVEKGKTGRHPLPLKSDFESKIQFWGINNDDMVILYDGDTGAYAARAWWMFRWLGHEKAAVLNGGYTAWKAEDYKTSEEIPTTLQSSFITKAEMTQQISADVLTGYKGDITDARDPIRFIGEKEPIDPIAGHIPGARCMPFMQNLDENGHIKAASILKTQFTKQGISDTNGTVCYCGSGVTAAHNILCLVHAGFPEPILYPGSWSEWITDPKRGIALGNDEKPE